MICLADNDIVKKLAICNLLDGAVAALGVSLEEILVLPTARFKLGVAKHPDKARANLGIETFVRLASFLNSVGVIDVVPTPEEQQLFEDALDIDSGEAILFSASAFYSGCIIATGDKRSLRALIKLPNAEKIVERLSRRVLCFEQIVLRCIEHSGFELVRSRAVPASDCDTALRAAFGSGLEATEETVRQCLTAYTEHLRSETGPLLADDD
ncbi:MAG: hypothetical protein ACKV2Q_02040 [Planctomycetaceae bacterium]